jgi:SAM-dependent methyltransferase
MVLEESLWIRDVLAMLDLKSGQTVLDIGSGNERYRCLEQPYIDYYVFRPLREKGLRIQYLDMQDEKGVDIVHDFSKAQNGMTDIRARDVIICANLLEHVPDRRVVLDGIKQFLATGSVLILSVPHIFPYHEFPIDTMYRPTNCELESLFSEKEFTIIESKIIKTYTGAQVLNDFRSLLIRLINFVCLKTKLKLTLAPHLVIIPNEISVLALRKS